MVIVFFLVVAVALIWMFRIAVRNEGSDEGGHDQQGKRISRNLEWRKEFVVFDVETTGLDPYNDEIVEIGAIKVDVDKDKQQTYQAFVKTEKRIPDKVIAIHGITNEMVEKEGIPLRNALEELREFIGDLPVVAYNLDFDKSFINNSAERLGMKKIIKYGTCALKKARSTWKGLSSYKLTDLAKRGGQAVDGMHRSLADCKATLTVYLSAVSETKEKYANH
jgi:DNA polymerase III epsilon subunit-like protein